MGVGNIVLACVFVCILLGIVAVIQSNLVGVIPL